MNINGRIICKCSDWLTDSLDNQTKTWFPNHDTTLLRHIFEIPKSVRIFLKKIVLKLTLLPFYIKAFHSISCHEKRNQFGWIFKFVFSLVFVSLGSISKSTFSHCDRWDLKIGKWVKEQHSCRNFFFHILCKKYMSLLSFYPSIFEIYYQKHFVEVES